MQKALGFFCSRGEEKVLSKSQASPNILKGFIRVHWLNVESHDSPLWDPRENASRLSFSPTSQTSAFLSWGSCWRRSSRSPSGVVSTYRVVAKDAASILREPMHVCALQVRPCRTKSLQCFVFSTFLWCQLMFSLLSKFSFSQGPSSAFCVHFVMVSLCILWLHVSAWACVCTFFFEISGNTVGNNQKNLQQFCVNCSFSDSHLCYLQVVCVQLETAYACLSIRRSSPWLAQSFLLILYKVFVFSQRGRFTYHSGGGAKTEVPTCPVGTGEKKSR